MINHRRTVVKYVIGFDKKCSGDFLVFQKRKVRRINGFVLFNCKSASIQIRNDSFFNHKIYNNYNFFIVEIEHWTIIIVVNGNSRTCRLKDAICQLLHNNYVNRDLSCCYCFINFSEEDYEIISSLNTNYVTTKHKDYNLLFCSNKMHRHRMTTHTIEIELGQTHGYFDLLAKVNKKKVDYKKSHVTYYDPNINATYIKSKPSSCPRALFNKFYLFDI